MKESGPRQRESSAIEKLTLSNEKYQKLAEELFETHRDTILTHPDYFGHSEIRRTLSNFDDETLQHYWGHGVTRGDIVTQIAAGISMIENNFFFGDAAPLRQSGHINAYTGGSFLAISRKNDQLIIRAADRKPQRVQVDMDGRTRFGLRMDAGAIVCNGKLESLVEPLRQMFPNTKILYAHELKNYLEEQEAAQGPGSDT